MDELQKYWKTKVEIVNKHLSILIPPSDQKPYPLFEIMRYCLFNGGKRLRPILTLAVNETLKGDSQAALNAGCAIEIIHSASLLFDDLPCMDDAELRRGKKVSHKVFSEGETILAADAMMNLAFEIIVSHFCENPKIAFSLVDLFARTIGSQGMAGGQLMDLTQNKKPTFKTIKYIHVNKTAKLFTTAIQSGVITSHAPKKSFNLFTQYAKMIGFAFQIVDDILDVEGDVEKLGKHTGTDRKEGRLSFVNYFGLEKSRRIVTKLYDQSMKLIDTFGEDATHLKLLTEFIVKRNY